MKMNALNIHAFEVALDNELVRMGMSFEHSYKERNNRSVLKLMRPGNEDDYYCVYWDYASSILDAVENIMSDYDDKLDNEMKTKRPCGISLSIKDVIYNPPATIVLWEDGTKTVVKDQGEGFDPEKGLAMAISKKALGGNGNYYEHFKKWTEAYYEKQRQIRKVTKVRKASRPIEFDTDIVYPTRYDAESVLHTLFEVREAYGLVTVADLYEASNIDCDYTASKFGWCGTSDLEKAKILPDRNGYLLKMPKPKEIR